MRCSIPALQFWRVKQESARFIPGGVLDDSALLRGMRSWQVLADLAATAGVDDVFNRPVAVKKAITDKLSPPEQIQAVTPSFGEVR